MTTPGAGATQAPVVTVIIIFLDEERYLQEAIESVLRQRFTQWELLLVDDGSTDASGAIARRFAGEDPHRVRYLQHPGGVNRGMSAARNLGLQQARGSYIAYLDGDDTWFEHKLEHQLATLRAAPEAVMTFGPLQRWYSWTGHPEDQTRDDLYGLQADGMSLAPETLLRPPELVARFIARPALIPAGILVETDALRSIGGAEERFRGSWEDAAMLVKLCLSAPVYVSGECTYRYRIHPESWCRVEERLGQSGSTHLDFLQWVESYLDEHGVRDASVRAALDQATWPYRHPIRARLRAAARQRAGRLNTLIGRGQRTSGSDR